jgi:hypothetical protein
VEQGELDQSVGEAEREVAMPPPNVQAEAPADGRPVPPQGLTPTMIDLTVVDPPSNKGKQKADVEMVDAPDRPGTSVALEDDMAEASAKWSDFAELALARAEEELPHWGRPLSSRTRLTLMPSPSLPSTIGMKCSTGNTSRDSTSIPSNPYGWSRIPWCDRCRRPLR